MIKWLQRNPAGLAILLAVLVVLAMGLAGCGQLVSDRPPDGPVRESAQSTSTESQAGGQGSGQQGEGLYAQYCRSCHGERGAGTPLTRVALKDAVRAVDQAMLIDMINKGLPGTSMPGFGNMLTGEQTTDLAAFIRSW